MNKVHYEVNRSRNVSHIPHNLITLPIISMRSAPPAFGRDERRSLAIANSLDNYGVSPIRVFICCERTTFTYHFIYINELYTKIKNKFIQNNKKYKKYYNYFDLPNFCLYYQGKPLRDCNLAYKDYNINENDYIEMHIFSLSGGSNAHESPTMEIVATLVTRVFVITPFTTFGEFIAIPGYPIFTYLYQYTKMFQDLIPVALDTDDFFVNLQLQMTSEFSITVRNIYLSECDRLLNIGDLLMINIILTPDDEVEALNELTCNNYIPYKDLLDYVQDNNFIGNLMSNFRPQGGSYELIAQEYILEYEWTIDLIEDLSILIYNITESFQLESFSKTKFTIAIATFVKLRTKRALVSTIFTNDLLEKAKEIFGSFQPQSFEQKLKDMRGFLDTYSSFRESPLWCKIHKFAMYCLTLNVFTKIGVDLDKFGYSVFEKEALARTYKHDADFYYVMLDTLQFLMEKGYQCIYLKEYHKIFHSGGTYVDFYDKAELHLRQFKYLNDPESFGIDESQYRSDLDDLIDKGNSIVRFSSHLTRFEKMELKRVTNQLSITKMELTTKTVARQTRRTPFAILITGSSSAGKTTLKDLLFYKYADIFDKPNDKSFCYSINPKANFWDGFTSSCWCVVIDEAASGHPDKSPQGDDSLDEVLRIINPNPFVPDQANLDDKGRTPLRCDLVISTTNVKDLHAHHYFSCPSAVLRRFPFIVTVKVKPEYSTDNQLDSAKAIHEPDEYPNFWIFHVEKVVPQLIEENVSTLGKKAKFETVFVTDNIEDFLSWYAKEAILFKEKQDRMMTSNKNVSNKRSCKVCWRSNNNCTCGAQSFAYSLSYKVTWYFFYQLANFFFMCVIGGFIRLLIVLFYFTRFERYLYLLSVIDNFCPYLGLQIIMRSVHRQVWMNMGSKANKIIGRYPLFIRCSLILGSIIGSIKVASLFTNSLFSKKSPEIVAMDIQGNSFIKPTPKDNERENVWYQNDVDLTPFQLTPQIISSKSLTREKFITMIERNVINFHLRDFNSGKGFNFRGVMIKGNICITNNHNIPVLTGRCELEVTYTTQSEGVNGNIKCALYEEDLKRFLNRDLCAFCIPYLPPFKDLTKYLASNVTECRNNGFYIDKLRTGHFEVINVSRIRKTTSSDSSFNYLKCEELDTTIFVGVSDTLTKYGQCGMPIIAETPMGFMLLGIHAAGNDESYVMSIVLDNEVLKPIFPLFLPQVSPGVPMLEAETASTPLLPLHDKSVVRFISQGSANIYGSLQSRRQSGKSSVGRSMFYPSLKSIFREEFTKPELNTYHPWNIAANLIFNQPRNLRQSVVQKASEAYLNRVLNHPVFKVDLNSQEVLELAPYDLRTTINGAPGVSYVDKIKRKTSAGNPWKTSKAKFLISDPSPDGIDDVTLTPEILDRVEIMRNNAVKGIRNCPVFCGHLKDEPIKFVKAAQHKVRLFTGSPIEFSILCRQYFLPLIRLMQNNNETFECAVGMAPQSSQWNKLAKHIIKFGPDQLDDGDHKAFDKYQSALTILYDFWILIEIARRIGRYSEEDITVMWTIAYDIAYAWCDFNGTLVEFFGSLPSGAIITVIINCLSNSNYMRMAYYELNPNKECLTFDDFVVLMTYGDDDIKGISQDIPWYNHESIENTLRSYGYEYTTGSKDGKTHKYTDLTKVTFLKRSFRFDEEIGHYMAALDESSIIKSLMTWTYSKSVSPQEQGSSIIYSANREFFFHGRQKFYEMRVLLNKLIREYELDLYLPYGLEHYDELLIQYYENSGMEIPKNLRSAELDLYKPQNSSVQQLLLSVNPQREEDGERMGCSGFAHGRSPKSLFREVPHDTKFPLPQLPIESNQLLQHRLANFNNNDVEGYLLKPFKPQSEEEPMSSATSDDSASIQQTTVSFDDNTPGAVVNIPAPIKSQNVYVNDLADISKFLTRPVLIKTYQWDMGGGLFDSFNPWNLYFLHPSIRKKLDNYYLIRCNLHLKFVINASPFHYGVAMASYRPLTNLTNGIVYSAGYHYICESQRPCIYLYPSNSQGGHLKLPFFYHKEWLDITNNTDTVNMGTIDVRNITVLQNANSMVGSSVNVQVFAWLDDVELTAPTVKLSLQGDEYQLNGPISKPASAIAYATSQLSNVPIIGKAMTATSMVMGAIGNAASIFGFTNVPVIDPVPAFQPHPMPHNASPEIGTAIEKLTLDPKNELSIDSSYLGADLGDELLVSKFCGRECLLTTFEWASAAAVNDLLFNIGISPNYQKNAVIYSTPDQSILYTTPLFMVGRLFANWRGDITIRLKFITSQFHRGRVRISWDPIGDIANTVNSTTEVFTKIVDLAECSDVSITVPYMQATAFLPTSNDFEMRFGTTPLVKNSSENGILTIRQLTDLTAPTSTSTITVLVFVRGAENIAFASPKYPDVGKVMSPYAPQGETINYDASEENETYMAMESSKTPRELYLNYHGEVVPSLRTLLRRFTFVNRYTPNGSISLTDITGSLNSRFARQPRYPGYDPNGPDSAVSLIATGNKNYNWVAWTAMTWLSGCFIASRGAIHWRANPVTNLPFDHIKIYRGNRALTVNTLTSGGYNFYTGSATLTSSRRNAVVNADHDMSGSSITTGRTLNALTISAPLYSRYKFADNTFATRTLGSTELETQADTVNLNLQFPPAMNSTANANAYNATHCNLYAAAGTDFNLSFFLNTPVLYIYSSSPVGA